MRFTYMTNRYPFAVVLDEEELFYMTAAERDANKVAASRIGLHNKDILLESFLTTWELPFQALKITGIEYILMEDQTRGPAVSGRDGYERQVSEYDKANKAAEEFEEMVRLAGQA